MSLPVSTHSYTIPHITHSRRTATNTNTTTQQNCNKVTEYHNITLILILILIEEGLEDKTHIIITKKENILGGMKDNKEIKWISAV